MKAILIGLFTLFYIGLFAQHNVIVSGKITNPEDFLANIKFYLDPLNKKEVYVGGILDETNQFQVSLKIDEPILASIKHGSNETSFFIEPGDSLHIEFDNWKFMQSLRFSGGQAGINNSIYKAYSLDINPYTTGSEPFSQIKILHPKAYLDYIKDLKKRKLQSLGIHQRGRAVSPAFFQFMITEIDFDYGNSLLIYPRNHRYFNNIQHSLVLPKKYYRFLKKIDINGQNSLYSEAYKNYLDAYITYQVEQLPKHEKRSFYRTKIKLTRQYLVGSAKHYMLTQIFIDAGSRNQLYELSRDVDVFLVSDAPDFYKKMIKKTYQIANTLRPGRPAPHFSLEDSNGNIVNLEDFRGKVIYLDFWATWCGPCRKEINPARDLKKRFKGKDVVFLYITLDTDKKGWKKFIKDNNMAGIHLFAGGGFDSKIAQLFDVKGVPTYYIIDKTGLIASNKPKRPSQRGVEQEIQAILGFLSD